MTLTHPWWRPKPPAPQLQRAALTPEQTITTALKSGLTFTQSNLLDLCRQHGADLNYPALRSCLAQLHRQGAISYSFSTAIIPGVPVLVYYQPARPVLPTHT